MSLPALQHSKSRQPAGLPGEAQSSGDDLLSSSPGHSALSSSTLPCSNTLGFPQTAKAEARTALDLAGASVIEGVLPLAGSTSSGDSKDSLTFHLQLAAPAAAGAGRQRAVMTLRAPNAGIKEAWVRELRAAAVGGKLGKQPSGAAWAHGPPEAGTASAPLRLLSSLSSTSAEAAQAHAGGSSPAAVPRKISTQVFADPAALGSPAAAAAGADCSADARSTASCGNSLVGSEGEPSGLAPGSLASEADEAAHEAALLAAIDGLAASRQPAPEEAALEAAVADAVRGYVVEARARLLALTQRVVSAGMLLGREEALRQALLDVLLPADCRPTWVGAD